uniref:MARVEL domain-containing protein n=1 Tax=Panagrellus redivivus TaxID=6233 RepID=A0A7E4VTI1_PANRE
MVSSPVLMSMSAIFFAVGAVLVILAGVSQNWVEHRVDRKAIASNREVTKKLGDSFTHNPIYFSRNYGLYHVCFPTNVPSEIGSYSLPFGQTCITNPDVNPDPAVSDNYSSTQTQRLWFIRAYFVFYLLSSVGLAIAVISGILSCWSQKVKHIKLTACVVWFTILLLLMSFSLWHLAIYWENTYLKMPPFKASWDTSLRQSTESTFGWSYYTCCFGLFFLILSGISFLCAARAIKREHDEIYDSKAQAYLNQYIHPDKQMMPYGYGTSPYGNATNSFQTYYPGSFYPPYNTAGANSYYGYMTYGGH